jgi:hypothetical protein
LGKIEASQRVISSKSIISDNNEEQNNKFKADVKSILEKEENLKIEIRLNRYSQILKANENEDKINSLINYKNETNEELEKLLISYSIKLNSATADEKLNEIELLIKDSTSRSSEKLRSIITSYKSIKEELELLDKTNIDLDNEIVKLDQLERGIKDKIFGITGEERFNLANLEVNST